MIILILSFALSVFTGFFAVSLVLGKEVSSTSGMLFRVSLGGGIGIGISSLVYFLILCMFGPNISLTLSIDILLFLILGILYYSSILGGHAGVNSENNIGGAAHNSPLLRLVPLSFILVFIISVTVLILKVFKLPHGRFDAWNIWNLRARFFFRGGENWNAGFVPPIDHADYPLYLPSYIAKVWSYVGNETVLVPIVLSLLIVVLIILLVYSILALFKSRSQGLIAGMLLIGTPLLVKVAISQYADLVVAYFVLCSLSLIILSERFPARYGRFFIICGVAAGMSAWAKNEGFLIILSLTAIITLSSYFNQGLRYTIKRLSYFAIGLLPVLAVVLYFKLGFNVQNDLVGKPGFDSIIERLFTASRYPLVIEYYVRGVADFGKFAISPILILGVYALLAGIKINPKIKFGIITSLSVVIVIALGYFFVYVITPHEIKWHFLTSFQRLLLHLWPSVVLMYFLVVRSPEEILSIE